MGKKIKLVDVRTWGFIPEPRYYFFGWSKTSIIKGRISLIRALRKAKSFLPKGYNFKIWDCYRPYAVQKVMMDAFRREINYRYPKLSKKDRDKALFIFGGTLMKQVTALGTHRRGGSIDLTIINKNGDELYMGTDHDNLSEESFLDYFERKTRLTKLETEAKKNRRLLKKVMKKVGFREYKYEWWHWNFDK